VQSSSWGLRRMTWSVASCRDIFTQEDRDAGAPRLELETATRMGRAADERLARPQGWLRASGAWAPSTAIRGAGRRAARLRQDRRRSHRSERAAGHAAES
jgi:hypothetical protein